MTLLDRAFLAAQDASSADDPPSTPTIVTGELVQRAVQLVENWAIRMAVRCYGESARSEAERAGGAPLATGNPFGYSTDVDGVDTQLITYRDATGDIIQLSLVEGEPWKWTNLSEKIGGVPTAIGDPFAFASPADGSPHVVYASKDGTNQELSKPAGGEWRADILPDIGMFEQGPTTLPVLVEGVPVPDAAINGVPRRALTLTDGQDAAITFLAATGAAQNSLGVYLVGANGEIVEPRWVFERIEKAPRDGSAGPGGSPAKPAETVLLSDLYDASELQAGVEFGLFLVSGGAARNPSSVFDGGTLEFRAFGRVARVTDTTPELVHTDENGVERVVRGNIMHTIDAGSPNPLSNALNPPASPPYPIGGRGQALSGLLDGGIVIAFEDTPFGASDKDFNDALFAVDLFEGGPALVRPEPASAGDGMLALARLEALLADTEAVA